MSKATNPADGQHLAKARHKMSVHKVYPTAWCARLGQGSGAVYVVMSDRDPEIAVEVGDRMRDSAGAWESAFVALDREGRL